jgi:signal transduction histidine kinase
MNRQDLLADESRARVTAPQIDPHLAAGTGVVAAVHLDSRDDEIVELVHDLRSPINNIGLELALLDDRVNAGDHQMAMGRIRRNLEFLDRLVQDLLDSYLIDGDRLEIRREPAEIRALLERVVERVVPTRDRGRVVFEAGYRATVAIDALRIERVVANLVGNAIKYAPPGSRIDLRLDVGPHSVTFSVTDAGPGMSPTEAAYVFDKHRRTPSAHVYEGAGIGLHVSKKIIEAHGGEIGVNTALGTGSRFYFKLARG